MSTVSKNLIKKNNNMHHFPNLDLHLLKPLLALLNGESGLTAFYERIVTMLFECVAAAQLDKIKVLCLKYLPQWICQNKDTKINKILAKNRV
mgnify:CR=1 FL=1